VSLYCAGAGRSIAQGRRSETAASDDAPAASGVQDCLSANAVPQEESSMQLSDRHREYWSKNLTITGILLFVWFIATFVVGYFAREINSFSFFGWPLAFYMAAQGSLIIYVIIIWYYARYMNSLDQEYGVAEGDDE
jgi:putative solute:sodium symporter small subunit